MMAKWNSSLELVDKGALAEREVNNSSKQEWPLCPVRLQPPRGQMCMCVCVRARAESHQSCLTLYNPLDCSPPGSSVQGIFQARAWEWGCPTRPQGSSTHSTGCLVLRANQLRHPKKGSVSGNSASFQALFTCKHKGNGHISATGSLKTVTQASTLYKKTST